MHSKQWLQAMFISAFLSTNVFGAMESESAHENHTHGKHKMPDVALPTEVGQSAFAAIGQIVHLLEADPETDWSRVNLDALRSHLLDMHLLTLQSQVQREQDGDTVKFRVIGSDEAFEAAKRMVPAHATELTRAFGLDIDVKLDEDSLMMTVKATESYPTEKIMGLGFYGLMTSGAHHQAHHFAIAKGHAVH